MSHSVQKYMTPFPHTVGSDATLEVAERMMHEHRVRHLPVLHGGKLVGILSERDIQMVETFSDVDPKKVKVEEAFTPEPFFVGPEESLSKVMQQMADHKYGCALVVKDGKLHGIFSWIDALRAGAEIIR